MKRFILFFPLIFVVLFIVLNNCFSQQKYLVKLDGGNTVKYTRRQCFPDSMQIAWARYYPDTISHGGDAKALVLDNAGNVYVTGYAIIPWEEDDYATVKYNSDGVPLWATRYNGRFNLNDEAVAIAVDNSENVYVTGTSENETLDSLEYIGDYITIKYNAEGVEQWIAVYSGVVEHSDDRARALTIDESGNTYVTGSSGPLGNCDFATIKYNSLGTEEWTARYNGLENINDIPKAIAVDDLGNVYVTGCSGHYFATIKYNSDGIQEWVESYPGDAKNLAIDDSANVYVAGSSWSLETGFDYVTIKYNSSGEIQWIEQYNSGGNNDDYATDLTIDKQRNVYVTGYRYYGYLYYDYHTVKYNSSGIQQWAATYNTTGYGISPTDIVVDDAGNVYITGNTTIMYDSAGDERWVATYLGIANALAVDKSSNVYVAGIDHKTIKIIKAQVSKSVQVNHRWNIVSLPVNSHDSVKSVFPNSISEAYSFTNGVYTPVKTLDNGKGYWLKFLTADNVVINGDPICEDSVNVKKGWNLIGSISFPVPVNSIVSDPPDIIASGFYRYKGSYSITDTLTPGNGYWVKVRENGKLFLTSFP